jgi:sugar O-acyltransferase (sialic acid O-acetyltransferase NeuD family)
MSRCLYGVYGMGGFGREVMPIARAEAVLAGAPADEVVFIDDRVGSGRVNGHRVMGWSDFLAEPADQRRAAIAVGDSTVRRTLAARLEQAGVQAWNLRADNVQVLDAVDIGPGAVLCPFVTLTSNIRIGRQFQANLYSYVAHDCLVGDFVTFAPAVRCNGNVVIEDDVYVGTGALIRPGKPGQPLRIGRGAVVGMGAVVTRDVPPGETVVGNPARPLRRN